MKFSAYLKFINDLLFTRKQFITEKQKSIFEINYEYYRKKCDLLIFDFDDTLSDHSGDITKRTDDLFQKLKKIGYKLAVFSNCTKKRTKFLDALLKHHDVYNVSRSDKPDSAGYVEVMKAYKITTDSTMMVGDRLGTDIYGGFRAGIKYRVQVDPYSYVFGGNQVHSILKFVRRLENTIYRITRR